MRKTTLFGKDLLLTEGQWSQLVARFDVDRAKQDEDGDFVIPIKCFCGNTHCRLCGFSKFDWGGTLDGCIRVLRHVCGGGDLAFELEDYDICWDAEDDKKARRQIQKVYTALMCMKQVEYVKKG